ncbi:class I SAM-dependent methyltransferase [Bogoriella caseilytica]|nr:class I SAM-dependent methyltransferase [Bogoriella caseilytica]
MAEFDKNYWEDHWHPTGAQRAHHFPANPYLPVETAHLPAGTALDAGCGAGTEALWLAEHGWEVTAADISAAALTAARARAVDRDLNTRLEWIETDLARWEPERTWDLVLTSYAHADIGQLAFYRRISSWVAPGGTLLIVGHLPGQHHGGHGHEHPEDATATLDGITALFRDPDWRVEAGYEHTRTFDAGGAGVPLHDVIVRARRLS